MADQVTVDNGSLTDYSVSTDDAGASGQVQRVKLAYSADGSATHVPADADGLLVNLGANNDVTITGTVTATGAATEATLDARTGSLTETAPATDTASSGLNGRLQRIAQRLTSLIALLPASLGQKTKANSLAVTLASDQDALPVTDNGGSLTVDVASLPLPSGASTLAEQQTQTTSLQLLDDLVIAEDAAHANGDKGIVPLAVRRDTATSSTATDGDYGTLTTDTAGRLRVSSADLTQPVSAASLPLPAGASTSANQSTEITALQAIQTAVETLDNTVGGTEMQVDIVSMPAVDTELTTADLDTGAGTDTRAVVGLVGAKSGGGVLIPGDATAGLKVDLGADNDVTVTGSVTANAGTNLNTSALALESGGNLAAAATSLAALDNAVAGNELQVDVLTMPTVAVTQSGVWDEVGINDSGNSITVDGTVTANLAAGTNNIGDVDVLTLPAIPAGTNNIGDVDVLTTVLPVPASTGTVTSVNDAATSATLLSSSATRKGFRIFNDSTVTLYVKYGATASATDYTVKMVAQSYLEENFYYGRVDGIWASDASGAAKITELT